MYIIRSQHWCKRLIFYLIITRQLPKSLAFDIDSPTFGRAQLCDAGAIGRVEDLRIRNIHEAKILSLAFLTNALHIEKLKFGDA